MRLRGKVAPYMYTHHTAMICSALTWHCRAKSPNGLHRVICDLRTMVWLVELYVVVATHPITCMCVGIFLCTL
jgi:hypothetical protein